MDDEDSTTGGEEVIMDDPGGVQHIILQGEDVSGDGQHIILQGEDGSGGGQHVILQGEDGSGNGQHVILQGEDVSGDGQHIILQGEDGSGGGQHVILQGEDGSGGGQHVILQDEDSSGGGQHVILQGEDGSGNGQHVILQGEDVSGDGQHIILQGEDGSGGGQHVILQGEDGSGGGQHVILQGEDGSGGGQHVILQGEDGSGNGQHIILQGEDGSGGGQHVILQGEDGSGGGQHVILRGGDGNGGDQHVILQGEDGSGGGQHVILRGGDGSEGGQHVILQGEDTSGGGQHVILQGEDGIGGGQHVILQGEDGSGGGQHVAVVDENGDTLYVQLPPNITLDGDNSIITSEVTEDGQQIFRILGVAENQVGDVVAEDVSMEQDQNMVIMEEGDQEVMIEDGDTSALEIEPPSTEADMMVTADEQQPEEEGVTFVNAAQEVEAGPQISEEEVIGGQDKATNIVMERDQGEGCELGEGQVLGDAGNHQDLALFQQALALLHQQSGGNVVITERDDTIYIMQQDMEENTEDTPTEVIQEGNPASSETVHELPDTTASTEMINIINPETGNVEAVPRSTLETIPESPVSDQTLTWGMDTAPPADAIAEPDMASTPITIAPRRRRPGRPRKIKAVNVPPPPKPMQEVEEEPVVLGASGRPRRKAAIKMLRKWEAMRKDDDSTADEKWEPSAVNRKTAAPASTQSLKPYNKENMAPKRRVLPQPDHSDHAASVSVTIRDSSARQVLSDIGIHMLYYCRRCTFFSTQLMAVAAHIHECREQALTETDLQKAADSAHTSSLFLNASLHSIAGSGRGNFAPDPTAVDQDLIEIDEHNYAAEVDIVKEDNSVVEESVVVPAAEVHVECHLCGIHVPFSEMEDHLRTLHVDVDVEEAVRAIQAAINESQTHQLETHQEVELNTEETPDVDLTQIGDDNTQHVVDVKLIQSVDIPAEPAIDGDVEAASAVVAEGEQPEPEGNPDETPTDLPADADPSPTPPTGLKFRCPQHELLFTTQAALTQHYIEVHWEVTHEKVKTEEQRKELEEQQKELEEQQKMQPPPVKRGRGRPRKIRTAEVVMEYDDDDVKDPDFEVGNRVFLPRFRIKNDAEGPKCQICYKRFASKASLQKHVTKSHTEDKLLPVPCTHCNKLFKNQVQQRNHIRTVHEGKKRKYVYRRYPKYQRKTLMCELCGYTTPELCRLKNHVKSVHEGDYPYKCDSCEYKTNEKADMRRHMHKHQGIKRYSCQFCTYRTDQRWLLVNHCHRQHGVQLEKQSRNTRGSVWSNQRRRKDGAGHQEEGSLMAPASMVAMETDSGLAFTQEIVIEQGMGDFYVNPQDGCLVPMGTNEHGEEVAMYTVHSNGTEEQVAIETIEEETHGGEVVYIREDGTVLDQDQAALMLLAVGPGSTNITHLDMDSAVHVETNYT